LGKNCTPAKKKTHKNPAMKAHGRRLRKSNTPSRLIMDALQPFRRNFKGGMIWQRQVKHFTAQAKKGETCSVTGIEDINCRRINPQDKQNINELGLR
jgi:hypothetical protein